MSKMYTLGMNFSTANSTYARGVPETSTLWEPPPGTKQERGCRNIFEGYIKKPKNATSISKEASLRFMYPFYDDISGGCSVLAADVMFRAQIIGDIVDLCEDDPACIIRENLKILSDIYKLTPKNPSEQFPLSEVFVNEKKVTLSKPLLLNIQLEDKHYIVSYDDFGLLAISNSPKRALREIQEEFSDLWNEYAICPEEELTEGAKELRAKLQSVVE